MATKKKDNAADEIKRSAQKIWLAGLGAFAVAEEEGSRLFRNLVERGESYEARTKRRASKVRKKAASAKSRAADTLGKWGEGLDDRIASALHKVGVPTRREIAQLSSRVEKLTASLDGKPRRKKKTAKKKTAKKKTAKVARKKPAARKKAKRA